MSVVKLYKDDKCVIVDVGSRNEAHFVGLGYSSAPDQPLLVSVEDDVVDAVDVVDVVDVVEEPKKRTRGRSKKAD